MRHLFAAFAFLCSFVASLASAAQIEVLSATYGRSCGIGFPNVTEQIRQACNGKEICNYVVDHRVIGDPARGCKKDYIALYACSGVPGTRSITLGEEASGNPAQLTCLQQ